MQDLTHLFQTVFESALFMAGLFYVLLWMMGHKCTTRGALFLFAFCFAAYLVFNLLSPIVPTYVFLIVCLTPSLLTRSVRALKDSKLASQIKLMFARKPSQLPEKLGSQKQLF